jgi:predicted outer membrane repeat protein
VELRDITLIATDGPHATTVDAGGVGSAIVFRNANGSTPLFEGFTLSSGTGTDGRGGGVFVDGASPTLRDCIITNNHTLGRGGGIYARNLATLVLESCLLQFNSTAIDGGGLFQSGGNLTLTDCTTHWNTATDNGGGLYLRNGATLEMSHTDISWNSTLLKDGAGICLDETALLAYRCKFKRNFSGRDGSGLALRNGSSAALNETRISGNRSMLDGGGIHTSASSLTMSRSHLIQNSCGQNGAGLYACNNAQITITHGLFRRNHSKGIHGGGLYLDSINGLHIDSTLFLTNIARQDGGAVYAENCSNSTFTYCAFARNRCVFGRGAAFHLNSSSPLLEHCTLTLNQAALEDCAIYGRNLSMPAIKNSILWGDTGEELILVIGHRPPGTGGSTTDISFTDVQGSWPGANNLNIDPDFASPLTNNFRLRATSPVRGMADDGSDLGAYPFGS